MRTKLKRTYHEDIVTLDWGARSSREVQARIDALLVKIEKGEGTPADRAEAVILAKMILRRS